MTEQEAILSVQQGSEEGFNVLYDLHHDKVVGTCCRILKNADQAQDAAQEVFLTLWKKIGTFRGDCMFSTWLYRLAQRTSFDMLRQRKSRIPRGCDVLLDHPKAGPGGGRGASNQEEVMARVCDRGIDALNRLCLADAYLKMSPESQTCLEMSVFQGHSAEEICRRTGMMSPTRVYDLSRAAKQQLREAVVRS